MAVNGVKSLRDLAVTAAVAQFRASGDLSMRKVAEDVGVTATALYHHFANKRALLDAVATRAFPEFEKNLRSTKSPEPSRIIRDILEGYRKFAADEPNLFGLMFVDARPSARKFPADFAAHRSAVFNLLWKAVHDWMTMRGAVEPNESLFLAHDIWALTHGQILLWRAGRFVDESTFRQALNGAIDRFIETL
jgi:AcrR family transcriptional regulator